MRPMEDTVRTAAAVTINPAGVPRHLATTASPPTVRPVTGRREITTQAAVEPAIQPGVAGMLPAAITPGSRSIPRHPFPVSDAIPRGMVAPAAPAVMMRTAAMEEMMTRLRQPGVRVVVLAGRR